MKPVASVASVARVAGAGGLLLWVPLLAALVFSWTRLIAESDDVPDDADYLAAKDVLQAGSQDGGSNGPFDRNRDALVILPPWSLRPLTVLGDFAPISGDDIADRPLHRWARLWAIVEADADDERAALIARRGPPSFSKKVGRVVVERWDLPPPSVSYDLAARLADARVSVVQDAKADVVGQELVCDRAVQRGDVIGWSCPKDGLRVTREHLLVSENGDYAVWAAPPAPGSRWQISWPSVPVGSAVVVTAGFTRDGAAHAAAPVRLRLLIDGELAGTIVKKPAFLFATDVIDTARFKGKTASVTFAIDSDDNSGAQFAFDATVLR